jgi:hypothetical protein
MWFSETAVFAIAITVQLVGLLSVVLTRLSERSAAQALCQHVFLASLVIVGAIAVIAIWYDISCWAICATTLPLMAVGATIDLHRSPQYSAF